MFILLRSLSYRYIVPGAVCLMVLFLVPLGYPVHALANSSSVVLPKFVPMKNMTITNVTTDTMVNGLTLSASEFTSTDTLEAIAKHYTREWKKAGFEAPLVELTSDSLGMFTAGENHLYSIQATKAQGEKRFGSVRSQGRLMVSVQLDQAIASTTTAFPLLTGNKVSSRMVNKDDERETETLLITSSSSMEKNVVFLIDRLERDGWVLNKDTPPWLDPTEGRVITGQRQSSYINISIVPSKEGLKTTAAMVVNWTK